jgi:hypothetical protein
MRANWITGPNPLHHEMYVAFGWHRVSARLKGDTWDLDWEVWLDAWLPHWSSRGRSANALCMARIDITGAWTENNIHIITRREHGQLVRKHYK